MKIALCQINTTVGDFEGNVKKIVEYANTAKNKGADLAVFPELSVTGYPVRDLVDSDWFVEKAESSLAELSALLPTGISAIVGCVTRNEDNHKPYNSAVLIRSGHIELMQHKTLLPNYDVFDERRNFESSKSQDIFWFKDTPIAISVCEDSWNNEKFVKDNNLKRIYNIDPITNVVRKGAKVIINISASPFYIDKWREREDLLMDIVDEHGVDIIYCNAVGGQDSLVFDGHSVVMTPEGIMAEAASFREDIVLYDTEKGTGDHHTSPAAFWWELKEALVLGIRDYVGKCGFKSVVIGLSGGLDSSVVAALAVEALGKENVTGLLMPSEYSSDHSITDATELANALDIKHRVVPIGPVLTEYKAELDLFSEDIVTGLSEENLQARIRGNYLMAYANHYPKTMVLSCSNRSESAVGYFTIYGDAVGGIGPIADCLKGQVYGLANFINSEHKSPIIPFNTIYKEPSAELAPGQIDKNSLPPYPVLDEILVLYIEDRLSAKEISERTGYHIALTEKITSMVDRNEFKRQQVPMNIKVSKVNFGLGRRLPIARK
jgi:NAD+ synthase (glutamine-hydrolysing)